MLVNYKKAVALKLSRLQSFGETSVSGIQIQLHPRLIIVGCSRPTRVASHDNFQRFDYKKSAYEHLGDVEIKEKNDNTVFQGIGPKPQKSTRRLMWPMELSAQRGECGTSIIPGKSPFLVSEESMEALQAITDHARAVMYSPLLGRWERPQSLLKTPSGHLLLPLFGQDYNRMLKDAQVIGGRVGPLTTATAMVANPERTITGDVGGKAQEAAPLVVASKGIPTELQEARLSPTRKLDDAGI